MGLEGRPAAPPGLGIAAGGIRQRGRGGRTLARCRQWAVGDGGACDACALHTPFLNGRFSPAMESLTPTVLGFSVVGAIPSTGCPQAAVGDGMLGSIPSLVGV